MALATIFGCEGPVLSEEEKRFFADADPWGFIVFARNIETPDQLRALTGALRESVGRSDAPILIDQEGGRVRRLRPPHWPDYPAGRAYGQLFAIDPEKGKRAAYLGARLMAADLHDTGLNVDCLPILDVPVPGAHDVIGDRAYGTEPATVIAIGRKIAEGLADGGVAGTIKHVPGHGRAGVDSHLDLPRVSASRAELEASDFAPFAALADLPMGMTAHVVYEAVDAERPATVSPVVIEEIIRGHIGFQGLLMTDDLSMEALGGSLGDRAAASLAAGCDMILHCNGKMAEMVAVAEACVPLAGDAEARADRALGTISDPKPLDLAAAREEFHSLLAELTT